jgi:hypothetical protein
MPASKATTTTILKVKLIIYSIRFSKKQKTKTHGNNFILKKNISSSKNKMKKKPGFFIF